MARRDPTLYYVFGLGAIVVGLAVAQGLVGTRPFPEVGTAAPDLRVPKLDGGEWSLSELRGRVVLLDFWARWCRPCVEQMPALERLARKLEGRPFQLLSVNIEDAAPAEVRQWLARRGHALPVAHDPQGQARAAYRVSRIPLLVLVGPDGTVRRVYDATATEGVLLRDIEAILSG